MLGPGYQVKVKFLHGDFQYLTSYNPKEFLSAFARVESIIPNQFGEQQEQTCCILLQILHPAQPLGNFIPGSIEGMASLKS
jgi:hypothetical protein